MRRHKKQSQLLANSESHTDTKQAIVYIHICKGPVVQGETGKYTNKIKIKNNKTNFKKKRSPHMTSRDKEPPKMCWVHFLLAIYFWACSLPLKVIFFPRETLLEETYGGFYLVIICTW